MRIAACAVAQSTAASIEEARMMLNPAGSSFAPVNGPGVTVRSPLGPKARRTPCELGRRPSPPWNAPVLAASLISAPTLAINSRLGR